MGVDDRDKRSDDQQKTDQGPEQKSVADALQSETDEPLSPEAEEIAERDADQPEPVTPQGRHRRWVTRRNAFIATTAIAIGFTALFLLAILAFRLGYVDRYVAGQIIETFAQYGIRAEITEFHTTFPPDNVEMTGIALYDAQTGEPLGKIDRLVATVKIEDLYALSLRREIDLRALRIEGFEAWINFDEQGRSNFRNIHIPPPDPNRRILFVYSTARLEIQNGVIHYGDARHEISGEARNLRATIQPDDPGAPEESWMNTFTLAVSDSSFVYDGRPVNNIDVEVKGRANQTQAEIHELVIRSPVAEATLNGTLDDWRNLRYNLNITSTVDLTQLSDVLQPGAALRGAGRFVGTVTGEGDQYRVEGQIQSDALAADGIRLRGLNVTASGSGKGQAYEVNGRAVAELLAAGDFQLNTVQLAGGVMGTGSDFRWLGELRAAAARGYGTTIAGLILHDARAEMADGVLTASSPRFTANSIRSGAATVDGVTASDLRLRSQNDTTTASVAQVNAGAIVADGTRVQGVTAGNISIESRGALTNVVVEELGIGEVNAAGAHIGSLNIAGVRLSVRAGRIEGSTADIDVGTVSFEGGQADEVRLARPVFIVEPSGRYRASADLSIGGGVLGSMNLGQARANVVASSTELQLNDLNADIFRGRVTGDAVVALTRRSNSRLALEFNDVDVAGPAAALSGAAIPLVGRANGRVDLVFPGTDFEGASGTVNTQLTAPTGEVENGFIPISGEVALRATDGLFQIDRVDLQTLATRLSATGRFSFTADSDLQVDLDSKDATELQSILISSGLLPEIEEQMNTYGLELRGQLAFKGAITGQLNSPDLNGRISLGSLVVNQIDLGSLSASINMTPSEMRVSDGRLIEQDGGGMQFSLVAPRLGENNIVFEASFDRMNARNLIAALPVSQSHRNRLRNTQADVSGTVKIAGIPNKMSGNADIRFGPGTLAGEPLESLIARANFQGSNVTIETFDVQLRAGRFIASGNVDISTTAFAVQGKAEGVDLSRLTALVPPTGVPNLTGTIDFNAQISGNLAQPDFSAFEITFDGRGHDITVNGRPAGTVDLVGRTENRQLNVTLTADILGPKQTIAARVDLASERLASNIETSLVDADLSNLFNIALPPDAVRVTGRVTGTIQARGDLLDEDGYFSLDGLQGTASFEALSFRVEDVQLTAAAPFVIRLSANELSFDKTQFTGPGSNIQIEGIVGVRPGGRNSLAVDGRLNLRVLNGISPDLFTTGTAEVAVRVTGTYQQPRLNGTASTTGASASLLLGNERWTVSNLNGLVRFTADQAQIDSLTGTIGGGRISATGGALMDGFTVSRFLINLRGEELTVPFPENFRSTLDADVELRGSSREQLISGVVNLRRAEYTQDIELADLINFGREDSIEEGDQIELPSTTFFSDLRVEGRNALVVRNNLADLVGSVSLQLNGPVNSPIISGRVTATSGTLNFRNDRYEITRLLIDLPPRRDADPIINIQAEAQIRGYRVIVSLSGPLSEPQAIVRSDPALPQADVVALITTGQLATGDTSASILSQSTLGTATSLLTDALINVPAQRAASRLFGLSRFEISPVLGGGRTGAAPSARLTVGRQINRNLNVTYSTNVASDPNQILSLEYRVSDRLSFIAQYEQGSTRRLTSRNDSFSFEIRFRRRF